MAKQRRTTNTVPQTLSNSLVLNRFILNLFGTKSLRELSENLKDPAYEGYTEDGVSIFAEQLKARLYVGHEITEDMLLEYDHNIFKHTQEISKNRDKEIKWKYFQYLSLLFTEIYLDKYFTNKEKLLEDIRNYHTFVFNNEKDTNHEIAEFTENDLNKLAFWSATGSGKTLLMHINILQFQHYLSRAGKKVNKTILITPNEGLTNQHIGEFGQSSIEAQQFSKYAASGFFHNQNIDIIEITKLAETDGDKTVAVESFEGNNLVLVDEGHRGSSGDKWKNYRDKLSKDGFAFEYSATFGQAINSVSSPAKRKDMLAEYAKATLFDYSYKYFYNDGYGKDYQILNMVDTWDTNNLQTYLTACLLNFYEQLRLYIDKGVELRPFLIERPLAIFVGSSVTADSGAAAERESSDVVIILRFFQRFVKETLESVRNIRNLLEGTDGLVNKNNHSIFTRSFKYLRSFKDKTPEQIYEDILKTVFHCTVAGAVLHLDNLRGLDGEIGMRIGNGDYFGVINVGDASKLVGKCVDAGINAMAKDYTDKSLFESINKPESKINILIGSKKFTEGWSSWRVSTMGLMNVGRSEGSQIIQHGSLFVEGGFELLVVDLGVPGCHNQDGTVIQHKGQCLGDPPLLGPHRFGSLGHSGAGDGKFQDLFLHAGPLAEVGSDFFDRHVYLRPFLIYIYSLNQPMELATELPRISRRNTGVIHLIITVKSFSPTNFPLVTFTSSEIAFGPMKNPTKIQVKKATIGISTLLLTKSMISRMVMFAQVMKPNGPNPREDGMPSTSDRTVTKIHAFFLLQWNLSRKMDTMVSISEMEEVRAAKITSRKKAAPMAPPMGMLLNTFGRMTNIRLGPL